MLSNLIKKSWIRKPYTIEISGGHTPAMPSMSLWINLNRKRLQLKFAKQNL